MQTFAPPQSSPKGRGSLFAVRRELALSCLDPPPRRRVELNGSGVPSGMTAQPQLVQGCTICGVPSDPESEMRENAAGGRLGGGEDLWWLWVFPKSLAPARRAGETPSRAAPSRPMRRSRIKGPAAGSGIRRESVVVERTICCSAMRLFVPLRGEATPPHQLRERLITLR